MKKRVAITLLWFYAFWYLGSTIAFGLGLSDALGPILGAAAAFLVAVDPRHRVWRQTLPAAA